MTRRVVLLRHGRTRYNAEGRLQGQVDADLDDVGRRQAAAAGRYLRSRYDVVEVVTSEKRRAVQTLEAAGLGDLPVRVDDRWREIDYGDHDRRRISEVIAEMGARWAEDVGHVPAGGESMRDLHQRVGEAWRDVLASVPDDGGDVDRTVVVVSHATPIKSAVVWSVGGGPEQILQLWVQLASLSVVRIHDGLGTVLERFNDVTHLAEGDPGLGPAPTP